MKNEIEIGKYPVPHQMLIEAENDPMLKGGVLSRIGQQVSISVGESVVGFLTPRKEHDSSWRTGAIYIDKEYRSHGYGSKAIAMFFSDKENGFALVESYNYSAQKAFQKAGLKMNGLYLDSSDNKYIGFWHKPKHF